MVRDSRLTAHPKQTYRLPCLVMDTIGRNRVGATWAGDIPSHHPLGGLLWESGRRARTPAPCTTSDWGPCNPKDGQDRGGGHPRWSGSTPHGLHSQPSRGSGREGSSTDLPERIFRTHGPAPHTPPSFPHPLLICFLRVVFWSSSRH